MFAALVETLERAHIERMYFRRVGYTMAYAGQTLTTEGLERRFAWGSRGV